jgi:uncharacterized delta-60 repeat protein
VHGRQAAAIAIIVATFSVAAALAAPGDLDPSFGTAGEVVTDLGGGELGFAIAPESFVPFRGEPRVTALVVEGQLITDIAEDFAVARYLQDGRVDHTFGSGGKVVTDFYGRRDQAVALAVQRDGRIVAAGTSTDRPGNKDFALARYQTNGRLDSSFGTGGKVVTDLGGNTDDGEAMAIQRDGKIVVAGRTNARGTTLEMVVVRYLANGSLDPTFGAGGRVFTPFPTDTGDVGATAIQRDGKILVGGLTGSAYGGNFTIARFLRYGRLDPTFGTGGKVVTDFGKSSHSAIRGLAVRRDGSIVAAGLSNVAGTDDFALGFYQPNGSLDPRIGMVVTDFSGDDQAGGIVLERNKIVFGGSSSTFSRFAVARYTDSGDLDPTFGTGGKVETSFGAGTHAAANSVTLFERRIIAAGDTDEAGTGDFALAAYQG